MGIIRLKDKEYPSNLKYISDPPLKLYTLGKIKKIDNLAVAIVGSRQMTDRGKKTAYKFSFELAKSGVTIVSGLARGIDSVAHMAALEAHGRTIAVLGSGINNIYPKENIDLINQITQNGAVVTEFAPQVLPLGKNFLIRNRIVSGLSLAVLVIEAKRRSGTLSTVTHAANQGREVFVVPGSELADYLIENGANTTKSPNDIFDYLRTIT